MFTPFAFRSIKKIEGIVLDPDAEAFLTATGITDGTITSAINNLVLDLKSNSLWTEMQIIYPFVGGTATTHKYNLKNPVDSNAAYRIGFNGGITHSSSGCQTDGINGWLNTYQLGTSIGASIGDFHLSIYADNIIADNGGDFGCRNNTYWLLGNMRNASNQYNARAWNNTAVFSASTQTATQGFYIVKRTSTSQYEVGFNGAYLTSVQATTGRPSFTNVFGAYNDYGTVGLFNSRRFQTITVGNGLTNGEADTLQTIIETFNNSLSR